MIGEVPGFQSSVFSSFIKQDGEIQKATWVLSTRRWMARVIECFFTPAIQCLSSPASFSSYHASLLRKFHFLEKNLINI